MNEKKNIDRLFQERFKDFEAVPNDKIWNNIHDALHEKKKKKVIPIWWKLSGIAAGLILAFLAFNTVSTNFTDESDVVIAPKEIQNKNSKSLKTTTETQVVVENNNSTDEEISNTATNNSISIQNLPQKNASVPIISTTKNNVSQNTGLVISSNVNQKKDPNKTNSNEQITLSSSTSLNKGETKIATNENNSHKEKNAFSSKFNVPNKNKTKQEKDSTALALINEPNPLEEILKKKKEKENEEMLAEVKTNRWQIATNIAPVYFNSASNGSPIEAQFEENSKSYENNLSVGIGVQYAVNKKLAVRTGLNKVTLAYGTNDVVFFGGLNASGVSNLTTNNATSNIEVVSANNTEALRPFEDNLQNTENGVLNQKMGYYEVPLELSYALVNRKFGINVIGGLSTLFLNENAVSVQSKTTTMSLGKASNLNDVHFSSNIGVGFKYEFIKNFEAHFEPTFKYQFNTFSRDAGNFKPYFVGLYTGVSFKF